MKKLGCIGLGKMGEAIVLHCLESAIDVVAYNRSSQKTDELKEKTRHQSETDEGNGRLTPVYAIGELVQKLTPPRIIWLMVAQGRPIDEVIERLIAAGIQRDDTVIDGGNSFYKDSIRRYQNLSKRGIHFLDIGTSGGVEGARNGACLMVGGEKKAYEHVKPILECIAQKGGMTYFGSPGAGHFVKMVHNAVEYGMLQSIGEGFEVLRRAPFSLNLADVAENWRHGSVVRGWLVDLLAQALHENPTLEKIEGVVGGGATGTWARETAGELGVATPALTSAIQERENSRNIPTFAGKIIAVIRNKFGGHEVIPTHPQSPYVR